MNNKIAASTIASSTTYTDALKMNTQVTSAKMDICMINYTGNQDIILQFGIDSDTATAGNTANEMRVLAGAGAMPAMPINAYWVKAKHCGTAPTTGNLDVSLLASGL